MKISGKTLIERICERLKYEGLRSHDSEIVHKLRSLEWRELMQLTSLGDVCEWNNDRKDK